MHNKQLAGNKNTKFKTSSKHIPVFFFQIKIVFKMPIIIVIFVVKVTSFMCFIFHYFWVGRCSPVHRNMRITGGQKDFTGTDTAHDTQT